MSPSDPFHSYQPLLFAIAYRMLGSAMDAQDMVQETFLRWSHATGEIDSPKAYLSAIVTRLCIDHLRRAHVQRETYIGPWLPEPLLASQPTDNVALDESLSLAFLVLLERLTPVERAVFLLREVFEFEYEAIARIVEKSEANCRQVVRRARQHLAERRPRFDTSPQEREQMTRLFAQSCATGDLSALLALLADDIVLYSDGGGKARAALNPILGPDKVARYMLGVLGKLPPDFAAAFATVNGQPAIVS